jgi:cyclophilin family peptidyl-prolyl cis-trans isomerase
MGTEKRERKKANRQARLAAEAAAEARRRRIRFIRNALILVAVIIIAGFVLAGCGDDDSTATDDGTAQDGASGAEGDADGSADTGDAPEPEDGLTPCPPVDGADDAVIDFEAPFATCIDPDGSYTAEVETTEGAVVVELDTERTPETTNNFVALARYGYYDDTDLFRIIEDSGIIQGGSPHTQSNTDPGPGFTIADEALPFTEEDYGPGALAMARTPEPDSGSAQFFFVGNDNGRYLGDPAQPGGGSYVVFGQTVEGLDVLEAIAALDDGTGVPAEQVSVLSITITEA